MPQITLSSGRTFPTEANECLLDAATRANIALGYSCRTGRCSSCKCKVVSGESAALHDELGLTPEEKAAGWILSCVRTATSDMRLTVEDLGGLVMPPIRTVPCRIHALTILTPTVVKIVLRLPPASTFIYHAGQYIDVIGAGGIRRSYSIANANAADKLIELHIRAVPGGAMSNYWFHEARVNDLLRLKGPLGTFFLRNFEDRHLIFLATGTGFAPVKAMLEALEGLPESKQPRSVSVYWGARTAQDFYLDPAAICKQHRWVQVLSRPSGDWAGEQGYVQGALLRDGVDVSCTTVYACGSDAMIHDARRQLIDKGLPEHSFHSDAFVCSAVT